MRWIVGALLVLGLLQPLRVEAGAEQPSAEHASIREHDGARRLLAARTIRLGASGEFERDYRRSLLLLYRPRLLDDIQSAYAAMLPEGEPPEFMIEQTKPGHYAYVNRKGQQSTVEELYRGETAPGDFLMILYVEGERWFGPFQSLIRIQVRPADAAGICLYQTDIDAYPESALLRGLARMGPVHRYFENKTQEMVAIALGVAARID